MAEKYFLKIDNDKIHTYTKEFNVKQVCIKFLLNEVRGVSDLCLTTIEYLIYSSGYTPKRGKGCINDKYLDILLQMEIDELLIRDKRYGNPSEKVPINDLIVYRVNPDKFDDCNDNFTKLTLNEFNTLIRNSNYRNKEILLHIYLYVKSYYHKYTDFSRPLGCFQSLNTISNSIGIAPKTLISSLNMLVKRQLLIKYYTGSIEANNTRVNVPNIYIPNLGQSDDEINDVIKSSIAMMKDFYKVKTFLPFMKNCKEN